MKYFLKFCVCIIQLIQPYQEEFVVGFKAEFAEYIIELRGKHKYTYK